MVSLESRFRSDEEEIAAKVLEGEAIMINLSNGIYYSLNKAGALMWELIAAGYRLGDVVTVVTKRYDVSAQQVEADLGRLAQELLQERLVAAAGPDQPSPVVSPVEEGARLPYECPKLEVYRDIGHLIALDPPMPGLKDVPWNEPSEKP
jgi:Coenzyme PQQ synthesis protein D (PqqD)